jgi:hypothetical protein
MTLAVISNEPVRAAPDLLLSRDQIAVAIALAAMLFCAALLPVTGAAYVMDGRLVNGINVWTKPLKFELSLAVHFLTLALMLGLLTRAARGSRLVRWTLYAAAVSCVAELGYIALQSARGRASHFNADTPIEAALYNIMGIGALILTIAPIVVGIQIWRNGRADFGAGLRRGAVLGLVLGGFATIFTAGFLSSSFIVETGRWVDGLRNDSHGIPLMGWSGTGGDLRVAHFFVLHAMQALPVLGLMADRWGKGRERAIVYAGVSVWLVIVAGTFAQALNGNPFIAWQ